MSQGNPLPGRIRPRRGGWPIHRRPARIPGIFVLAAVLGLGLSAAPAEDGLTLEKAVETALARHPDILAAQAEVRAASARRLQAGARPDPALSLSTEGIPFGLKNGEGRETEISLGLEQRFEFPGKRSLRLDIGRIGENIAGLELERTRLLVAARVKRAYFRLAFSERTAAVLEKSAALLAELLETAQTKYQAGRSTYGDVLRVRVEKARLANRGLEERREQSAAAAELAALLGRELGEPLRLSASWTFPPLPGSAAELKSAALAARPSLRIAALRVEQADAALRLAGRNRRPDLTAALFLPSRRFGAWGFALGLTLPLSKDRSAGERAEAAAARDSGQAAEEGRRRRIAAQVDAAVGGLRLAEEQVRIFEQKLLGEIEAELELGVEYFQYGKIESYALLDLHRAALEARIEHARALYLCALARIDLDVAGEDAL